MSLLLFLRLKCIKLCVANIFRGFKGPRKLWLMLLEAKRINKIMRDDFTSCKTLRKLEPIYFEVKLKA